MKGVQYGHPSYWVNGHSQMGHNLYAGQKLAFVADGSVGEALYPQPASPLTSLPCPPSPLLWFMCSSACISLSPHLLASSHD